MRKSPWSQALGGVGWYMAIQAQVDTGQLSRYSLSLFFIVTIARIVQSFFILYSHYSQNIVQKCIPRTWICELAILDLRRKAPMILGLGNN